jgi:hypothetical protein
MNESVVQAKMNCYMLSRNQLKILASKHRVKVTSSIVEGLFNSSRVPVMKSQYVNRLAGIVTEKAISAVPKETPNPDKKKRRRNSDDS